MNFLDDNFLLHSRTAEKLYHEYAAGMPIYDYHCHLPPERIAEDRNFENMTQIWLYGDHYKWRAMRTNGVAEKYCTGDASDWEKFEKWAQTVPYCLRNPLYHWTHMELKRPFGITGKVLNSGSAREIYEICNEKLAAPEFSPRRIMRQMNLRLLCTTDDPTDDLAYHKKIADDGFEVKVYPTWRPDKGMAAENVESLNKWIDRLAEITDVEIKDFDSYLDALRKRHDFFHQRGCRLSDRGLDTVYAENYTAGEIEKTFIKIRQNRRPEADEVVKFKSAMLIELGIMDAEKGWTMQLHIGALRNNNTKFFKSLGPDTGFDSINDIPVAQALSKFLDRLDSQNKLPKTILYNLNPRDNEVFATMAGNFQDGSAAGKIQFGSGWWFLDQKDGMQKQIEALSNLGLLSRFVGMLTDSRSFLSYPRHEYFRRILCSIIGKDVENGELPADIPLLGQMIEDISYNNAVRYFGMDIT